MCNKWRKLEISTKSDTPVTASNRWNTFVTEDYYCFADWK